MQPKLGIGSVLFGMDYGLTKSKQVSLQEVRKILALAEEHGVELIDTAPSYGESERVLGKSLRENHGFKIVTKTIKFSQSQITKTLVERLQKCVLQSLHDLKQRNVYGLLFHQSNDLFKQGGEQLYLEIKKLKERGVVNKIGVSVYTAQEIDQILHNYDINLIQLPINVLDQRLLYSGHLKELKKRNIEIHARSVFLQGLLTMPVWELPKKFDPIVPVLAKYHRYLHEAGYSPIEGAIQFVKGIAEIDYMILGINSSFQLLDIIQAYNKEISFDYTHFSCHDEQIIDPRNW